jgi:UDP-2,4-diacetamido-2,4,6-trideoxy-beta-L-altropyranose hydrolase
MRCLALADALRGRGFQLDFAVRRAPGDLRDLLAGRGYGVLDPGPDPSREIEHLGGTARRQYDWVVLDHYGLDATWLRAVKALARKRLVLDDLGDRPFEAEVLVDPNLDASPDKYAGLLPSTTRLLLGPRYALLRREFAKARRRVRPVEATVDRVVVSMGGADPDDATALALRAVRRALPEAVVDVVVGPAYRHVIESTDDRVFVHRNVAEMAGLLLTSDLAVGAGGGSSLERCALGLPSVTLRLAPNQAGVASSLGLAGAAEDVGWLRDMTEERLADSIRRVATDRATRQRMQSIGMATVDGRGASRVAGVMDLDHPPVETVGFAFVPGDAAR